MQRLITWFKTHGDHNIVSYSRFGLPGEERDDKPPPTTVHVAPFIEDSKEFLVFRTHSQRAAVMSVGVGMSLTMFIVLSVLFEFDWRNHHRGIDVSALMGLFLFLVGGLAIHWGVIRGIKMSDPKLLVPFIIVYMTIIVIESALFFIVLNRWVTLTLIYEIREHDPMGLFIETIMYIILVVIQSFMLYSVSKCRNYLDRKNIHTLEMRLVEKIKQQYPGINVVRGAVNPVVPNIGIASASLSDSNVEDRNPPAYDQVVNKNPQRTIFQAEDGTP